MESSGWAQHGMRAALAAVASLSVAFAAAQDDPPRDPTKIVVTFQLPADADLEVQGKKIEGSGESRREIVTIAATGETVVNVRASWLECDTKRQVKRALRLMPGKDMEVDLNLEPSADEKSVIDLINKEREKAGLKALSSDPKLNRAARAHSLNMAKQKHMEHMLDGKGPPERLKDVKYRFNAFGENVAFGALPPVGAVQQWMKSQGHRENILTPTFTETGVGIAIGQRGQKYYTQVFATPGN